MNVDPWHIDDVKATFNLFDLNGDGDLCVDDWLKVLKLCNVETTTKSVKLAMEKVEKEGSNKGVVDFETFVSMLKSDNERCKVDLAQAAFTFFDNGDKGEITAEDLVKGFEGMGSPLDLQGAKNIMEIIDIDKDGKVSLSDFSSSIA
eukprot:g4653.t1